MNMNIRLQREFMWKALVGIVAIMLSVTAQAQDDMECYFCHGEADFSTTLEDGTVRSLFVSEEIFNSTAHGENGCVSCHADIEEVPHAEKLLPVNCGGCHEVAEVYAQSLHGQALAGNDPLAPTCATCHGAHDIVNHKEAGARTNPINVPGMCGSCHAKDAPVARSRNIHQHDILQNYEQGIHGEGILKKGLTVTAVCTSCHTAHSVLPHTDKDSTLHRDHIVGTCTQCHALIEQVHQKVIDGEMWEKEPHNVPICIDCHQPHIVRNVFYDTGISDRECMVCHEDEVEGASRTLDPVALHEIIKSTHAKTRCAQCHAGANPSAQRPCETVSKAVDCATCHADQVAQHENSAHGQAPAEGKEEVPSCIGCHGGHTVQAKDDPLSPTFPRNVPELCARCHKGEVEGVLPGAEAHSDTVNNYAMSIHGRGLLESGLVVTATCTNCHTAHQPLASSDPESSVHHNNLAETCGECHSGIEEKFSKSIHSPLMNDTDKVLPVCSGCHTAHSISRADSAGFTLNVMQTCGRCHEDVTESYFETFHGKVSKLGSEGTAKCHDCHGAHDVLPVTHPESHLSRDNIVATCGNCHEGSHRRFAGYLTHATHHDKDKYPILFYTFWGMTALLVGTFSFFGMHTLLWLPLSFKEMLHHKRKEKKEGKELIYRRFDGIVRQLHFVLILSFFGVALTGMTLKFSYMPWAQTFSRWMGGFDSAGTTHRVCAVIMIAVFIIHLGLIVQRKHKSGKTWMQLLLGTSSLLPQWHDVTDFIATIKWFLHMGPRPRYGKWTYWEKFDYFAVFWGVAIIGSTGFVLWFPELCTHILPGWFINVATIIHSDEALLAVGFIFTIHFFNTHFRPEKFPMDMVMFTGRITVEELKAERPQYYDELVASGKLEERLVNESSKELRFWGAVFGTIALIVGFSLVLFIIWSMTFGYQ
jgi:cytochrome b subunit of formate dehydrogenase